MAGFSYTFEAVTLNEAAYRAAVELRVKAIIREAARVWLGATVLTGVPPTWSGASRATFEDLARSVGIVIPYGPQKSRENRYSLGRANSSGGVSTLSGGIGMFTYSTSLRYLAYNESNLATKGPPPAPFSNNVRYTPYNFITAGKQAVEAYFERTESVSPWDYKIKRIIRG